MTSSAVNAAGAGVTASKVSVGGGEYRLQFTASKSGSAGAFTITDPGTTFTDAKTAQDAEIQLWAATSAQTAITSSTNTFADVLQGVSVTVSEITATPVTLEVARDVAGITKLASDLVAGANGIFSLVASKTAVSSTTNASGASTSAGIFTGDSSVRGVNQAMLSAASLPVGTPPRSPSEIGISITRNGTMEFDDKKFAAALARLRAALRALRRRIRGRRQPPGRAGVRPGAPARHPPPRGAQPGSVPVLSYREVTSANVRIETVGVVRHAEPLSA
ncbi:flagellar filament capping protein FliD [Pseudarthrobacter sp. S9]|uniref:flagellar filament capping protein FliD n=1 Tax=Pseudarthrobacter sp. S9 TaxID=3418421 RepID=UPI003D0452F4